MQAILAYNKFLLFVFILEYHILSQDIKNLTLLENEQVLVRDSEIAISIDDQFLLSLQSFDNNHCDLIQSRTRSEFEIFELYSQQEIEGINSFSKIFTFLNYKTQFFQVWVFTQNAITLHFEIENTLQDQEIIYVHQKTRKIELHHQDCNQFNQVYENIFIILCNNDQTLESILQLIDSEGAILDAMVFKINNDCKQSFQIQANKIIFNEANCKNFQIIIIYIDFDTFQFKEEKKHLTDFFIQNGYEELSRIINCQNEKVVLVFSNAVVHFLLQNFKIIQVLNLNNINCLRFFYDCRVEIFLGVNHSSQYTQEQSDDCFPSLFIDSSDQILKHEVVNQNALILLNNKLLGYNNMFYNQTLNEIRDFAILAKLPFIVSISNTNKLQIVKINQFSKIISTKQHQTYLILRKQFLFVETKIYELINVQKYNSTLAELLIVDKRQVNDFYLIDQKLILNDFTLSYPLKAIDVFSEGFSLQIDNNLYEYPFKIGKNQILIDYNTFLIEDVIFILYQIYHKLNYFYQLILTKCERNASQKDLFIQEQNQRYNIFQILSAQYIVTNGNKLVYVAISATFKIHQKQFQFSKNILDVQVNLLAVKIIFYDGTQLCYEIPKIESIKFAKCGQLLYFDFKKQIYREEIEINPQNNSQLNIKMQGLFKQVITVQGQITHFHIFEKSFQQLLITILLNNHDARILLFGKQNTNTQNKHFYRFLYEVPLYGFQPITPLKVNFNGQYFQFVAIGPKNQRNYLMIYDSKSHAVKSLIFVKEVDPHIVIVNLFAQRTFIYYSNKKLILGNMLSEVYSIKLNILVDSRTIKSFIKINVSSIVSNDSKNIMIEYNFFNNDQRLRFKTNVQEGQRFLQLQNNDMLIGLEKIFGQIDEIKISKSCQAGIQNPIQLTNEFRLCNIFLDKLCEINDETIIYDPFGKNMQYNLHNKDKFIIGVKFQQDLLFVYTCNNQNRIRVAIYLEVNPTLLISKYFYPKFQFNSLLGGSQDKYILTQENEILYGEHSCVMIIFRIDHIQDFELVAEYHFANGQQQKLFYLQDISNDNVSLYFWLILNVHELYLSVIQINKSQKFDIQFSDQQALNLGSQISYFQIKNITLSGSVLQISLILKIILKQSNQIYYLYEIQFDLNSQIIISGAITQYFRLLEHTQHPIFIMDKLIIYQAWGFKQPLIYIFPSQRQTDIQSTTDYIFSYQISNQSFILQYNLTHLVFYDYNTKLYQLVRIDFYHLLLENVDESCQISLFNKVSTLEVNVVNIEKMTGYEKKIFLFCIIGINCILIMLFTKMKRKQKNYLCS